VLFDWNARYSSSSVFYYFNLNKAEWWQLIEPENRDNEVRVVRNLCFVVSL
jgi:hypothetical protein